MSLFPQPAIIGASEYSKGYPLEDSLRFRSSASAYLNRTPASAGNRKTWTWSGWVKRSELVSGNLSGAFFSWKTGAAFGYIAFYQDGFRIYDSNAGYLYQTTAKYRDVSSWYHIVVRVDTTEATASNRVRLYINGVEVTSFTTETNPAQNADTNCNTTILHTIGLEQNDSKYFDGYLTEVNFIDGQALDPSYFGETDVVTGVWKPKKYTGTYGTNGFYLPMTPTSQAEGFNTVIWPSTNGVSGYITNVGFSPDFIWGKSRDNVQSHHLVDSIRGGDKVLFSNLTNAEATNAGAIISFDSDGFSYGTSSAFTNGSMVAWCWDAGSGSPASNTDGSITSTVKANQAKGFSIVTYTGTGSAATVGHGLGVAPSMIIVKNRSSLSNWYVGHDGVNATSPWNWRMILQDTDARANEGAAWNDTAPTSSVFSVGTSGATNASGDAMVAYCFSEVAGYSKIGSYTGTGASGNSITTGFKPAWLLIKRTDSADKWTIRDGVRSPSNPIKLTLNPNDNIAEYTPASEDYDFDSNGFTLNNSNGAFNASGGTYIYMAIADTRNTAFNNDASGNKNNWTPNNINSNASGQSTYDLMKDVPTLTSEDAGNYATLNPLDKGTSGSVSNGNLNWLYATAAWNGIRSTFSVPKTGKWYWEATILGTACDIGIYTSAANLNSSGYNDAYCYSYGSGNAAFRYGGVDQATVATYTTNDVIAYSVNEGEVKVYKNNSLIGTWSQNLSAYGGDYFAGAFCNSNSNGIVMNFGQRPFTYTPPSGFKALNTYNLPDPTVKDGGDYFNALAYSGTGTSRTQTGVGFQPDFVWIKQRNSTGYHNLFDVIRGAGYNLSSNSTDPEANIGHLTSFASDGFGLDTNSDVNASGSSYISWNWKSNGSGVSNTDGSTTSTVSANTSSGFSVVTYTGTGSAATIGHGLGIAPSMLIVKRRSNASTWTVYHASFGAGKKMELNGSAGLITNAQFFPSTPTSSVFSLGTEYDVNGSGGTFVSYCFAPVEGFSAFGSYAGNSSSDGPFVYCGFRPRWIMIRSTSAAREWNCWDTARGPYNLNNGGQLNLGDAHAEYTGSLYDAVVDVLSNGFKLRSGSSPNYNQGETYIYAVFADNPFKYSLAR